MYSTDLTLDTATYSLTSQRTNSSVRSDASQPLSEPNLLTISHETAKNGRRSSVIIFDDTKLVEGTAIAAVPSTTRLMIKLQFDPMGGRTDHEATVSALIAQLSAFIGNSANITKFLNQES